MKRSPNLAIVLVLATFAFAWLDSKPSSDIRFFCANDRIFIEFEEDGHVWGTMWVDDDGKPLSCSGTTIPKTKSSVIKDI